MQIFEMIVIITIVTTIAGMFNNFIKLKSSTREDMGEIDVRLQKLEDLEERIKVLETIITDQNYDLDRKIKEL